MQNFEFQNPTKVIFGKDTIPRIGEEMRRAGVTKALLVAGGGSIKRNGVYHQTTASLKTAGIAWEENWGVQPNPVIAKVRIMIEQARRMNADAMLAVGGGSVLDSAKAAAAGVLMEDDIWKTFEARPSITRALPIFAILTLSATGSEMNQFSVVTNEAEKKKWAITGPALYPKVSIIDPSVQATLPWNQTVHGALDAISHIQEAYFMRDPFETTLAIDDALLKTIIQATDRLRQTPADYESRAALAWAATLALNGLSGVGQSGGDWACHGIEHALSGQYPSVAHAAGLGVIFPAWIRYCRALNPPIFARWAKNVWDADDVEAGVAAMQAKIKSWDGVTTLAELGVSESSIGEIAASAIAYGRTGNLKKLSDQDIRRILTLAFR